MPRNCKMANGKPVPAPMIYPWMVDMYNASANAVHTTLEAERNAAAATRVNNVKVPQAASTPINNVQIQQLIANQVASQVAAHLAQAQQPHAGAAQPAPTAPPAQPVATSAPPATQYVPLNPTNQ